jgi:hypothetical protein
METVPLVALRKNPTYLTLVESSRSAAADDGSVAALIHLATCRRTLCNGESYRKSCALFTAKAVVDRIMVALTARKVPSRTISAASSVCSDGFIICISDFNKVLPKKK